MSLCAPANRKIPATATNDTLVIQPTSSQYYDIHATPTNVINKNTVKPVLNGTWIEQNPAFTGKISPSQDSLTSNTCTKWKLPATEKHLVPCSGVTGSSHSINANCQPCGLIHHLNKPNDQSISNSRISNCVC